MPENSSFVYDWWLPLSKYNTLRYEDINRTLWQNMEIGRFIRNDRFFCERKPKMVTVTIRKTYTIPLAQAGGIFYAKLPKPSGRSAAGRRGPNFILLVSQVISESKIVQIDNLTFSQKYDIIISEREVKEMETLKRFRVDFQVTYYCKGRKGFFHKKPYKFTVIFKNDYMNTSFLFNVRTESEAIKQGKEIAERMVERNIQFMNNQAQTNSYMILTGNMKENGDFAWSPKFYDITGYEIKLISSTFVQDWSKARVEEAVKSLTMEQFKQVFNEIPMEVFD